MLSPRAAILDELARARSTSSIWRSADQLAGPVSAALGTELSPALIIGLLEGLERDGLARRHPEHPGRWCSMAWLSIREAAEAVGVSARTMERELARGRVPHRRVGGQLRIRPDDLERAYPPAPAKESQSASDEGAKCRTPRAKGRRVLPILRRRAPEGGERR